MGIMRSFAAGLGLHDKKHGFLGQRLADCVLRLGRETKAVSAIEYALIIACVGVIIVGAMLTIGNNSANTFNTLSNSLPNPASPANAASSGTSPSQGQGTFPGSGSSGGRTLPPNFGS